MTNTYAPAEKAHLKDLKKLLRTQIATGEYWIAAAKWDQLVEYAHPFNLPDTLKEMGYRIADRAEDGANILSLGNNPRLSGGFTKKKQQKPVDYRSINEKYAPEHSHITAWSLLLLSSCQ